MSAKALKTMKEENPELQKQIGCISGFFQLFDRHRLLTGQRTSGSHSQNQKAQNRPTPGGRSNNTKELNGSMQKPMANNPNAKREKQQFSTESSMTSMSSSSRSSSMSSLEFNRTVQIEPPSATGHSKFPDPANFGVALKQIDTPCQQSPDLRDIVRDSMYREGQGLSVKRGAKEERKGHSFKHIDSPRPLLASKSANTKVVAATESFHVPARFQKTPWDSPRLSYDGRDTRDIFKSTMQKELPRLSLDSREGSIRGFNEGAKSHNFPKINQLPESEASKRASSVIAKLMGLEAFPNLSQNCESPKRTSTYSNNEKVPLARLTGEYKQYQTSGSPRTCKKEFTMPRTTRTDSVKPRFSLEEMPCRQPVGSQGSQSPASKGRESSMTASNPSLSVYGEMEKRVAELEFKKSGKDLRALKQILEAMQRYKNSLDTTRDQTSDSPSKIMSSSGHLNESSKMQSPRNSQKGDSISITDTVEIPNSPQGRRSPIVIMKPAKVTRKMSSPASNKMLIQGKSGLSKLRPGNSPNGRVADKHTAGCFIPRMKHNDPFGETLCSAEKSNKRRTSKLMQSSKVPQDANGENTTNSSSTGTESPRLEQRMFSLERCSRPGCPSSNFSNNRRKNNSQSIELSSPRTPRQKFPTLQEGNDCFSKTSVHRQDFEHHVDSISPGFDRDNSLASDSNIELFQIDQFEKINTTSFELHGLNLNNADKELGEARSTPETEVVMVEKPSPVSVLDPALFRDDPPSPVKKKSHHSKFSNETLNPDEREENSTDLHFSNTTEANFSNGINDREITPLQWVQELHQVGCSHAELINLNKPPCDRKDPDHKYISEILLASGLLNSPSSCQTFHSSNHLINPKLFLALEQIQTRKKQFNIQESTKISKRNNDEQIQRKLIFDVVNDLLVQKLILESSSNQWFLSSKLAGVTPREEWLLQEICSEIDQLQHNNKNGDLVDENDYLTSLLKGDLMHHHTKWTDCYSEVPNVVLDIERLIFKDLITEIVRGEEAHHPRRPCRQLLFPK